MCPFCGTNSQHNISDEKCHDDKSDRDKQSKILILF